MTIDLFRKLRPSPRAVVEEIYRAAAGWHSDECVISVGKLSLYTNLDPKHVRRYLGELERDGYIKRLGDVVGGTDLDARGIRFRILLPRLMKATPSETGGGDKSRANKINASKDNSKGEAPRLAPKEIDEKTAEVVEALRSGEDIEAVAARLAPSMHPADWARIRSVAEAQARVPVRETNERGEGD